MISIIRRVETTSMEIVKHLSMREKEKKCGRELSIFTPFSVTPVWKVIRRTREEGRLNVWAALGLIFHPICVCVGGSNSKKIFCQSRTFQFERSEAESEACGSAVCP